MLRVREQFTAFKSQLNDLSNIYSGEEQIARAKLLANFTRYTMPVAAVIALVNIILAFNATDIWLNVFAHLAAFSLFPAIIFLGDRVHLRLLTWIPFLAGIPIIFWVTSVQGDPYVSLAFFALSPIWALVLLRPQDMITLSILSPFSIVAFYLFVPNTMQFDTLIEWLLLCVFFEITIVITTGQAWARELSYREQLLQQKEKIVRRDAMQQYITAINHDFRTPLATILLSSQLINYYVDDEANRQKHTRRIETSVKRIDDIVSQSNTWVELTTNPYVDITSLWLDDVLSDIKQTLDPILSNKALMLDLHSTIQQPIMADTRLLRIALNEILINAITYSAEQNTITIRSSVEEKYAVIQIIDTGSGIDPLHIHRVFDVFYRGDDARTANKGRNGLGLTIAKRCIELQHGHLTIESQLNVGTTVSIQLRLANT